MPATTPLTHLRTVTSQHDVLARTWELPHGDGTSTLYFSLGSATGPVHPMFEVVGVATPGTTLRMAYNYRTNEYVNRTEGWEVELVRINTKTMTVRDLETGTTHRVEL